VGAGFERTANFCTIKHMAQNLIPDPIGPRKDFLAAQAKDRRLGRLPRQPDHAVKKLTRFP
jgi:hypothetical protein